jgi:excisionase family DNA binding protein
LCRQWPSRLGPDGEPSLTREQLERAKKAVAGDLGDRCRYSGDLSATCVESDWYTSAETATRLDVSERTVQRYVQRGLLTAVQLVPFGPLRIRREDVERLLDAAIRSGGER